MAKLCKERRGSKKLPLESCLIGIEMCAGGQFVGVKTYQASLSICMVIFISPVFFPSFCKLMGFFSIFFVFKLID